MIKKLLIPLLLMVPLAGCGESLRPSTKVILDQELRSSLFQACLKALPAGPQSTQYNDWDEVVQKCENSAFYQSQRTVPYNEPTKPHWREL